MKNGQAHRSDGTYDDGKTTANSAAIKTALKHKALTLLSLSTLGVLFH